MIGGEAAEMNVSIYQCHPQSYAAGWQFFGNMDDIWINNSPNEEDWDKEGTVHIDHDLKYADVVVIQVFENHRLGQWLDANWLKSVIQVCHEHNIPVIMDEVFGCCGRLGGGKFFSFERYGPLVADRVTGVVFGKGTVVSGAALRSNPIDKKWPYFYKELVTTSYPAMETLKGKRVLRELREKNLIAKAKEHMEDLARKLEKLVAPHCKKENGGELCRSFYGSVWFIPERIWAMTHSAWPAGLLIKTKQPMVRILTYVYQTPRWCEMFYQEVKRAFDKSQEISYSTVEQETDDNDDNLVVGNELKDIETGFTWIVVDSDEDKNPSGNGLTLVPKEKLQAGAKVLVFGWNNVVAENDRKKDTDYVELQRNKYADVSELRFGPLSTLHDPYIYGISLWARLVPGLELRLLLDV